MGTSTIYGYGQGDDYFKSTCTQVETTDIEQWCTLPNSFTCSYIKTQKSFCTDQDSYDTLPNIEHCAIPLENASCRSSNSIEDPEIEVA
jgi:hypothetical protein